MSHWLTFAILNRNKPLKKDNDMALKTVVRPTNNNKTILRILLFAILLTSTALTVVDLDGVPHIEARCPNGYHKSPSGDCEKVTDNKGNPRCPNGYHRSPGGICEQITPSGNIGVGGDGGNGKLNREVSPSNSASNSNVSTPSATPHANGNNSMGKELDASHSRQPEAGKCDQSLWKHVYNPQRLQIVDPCKTVSGVIESKRVEADGDYHIRLKLDPQFSSLVNAANLKGQYGDLVVEPICMNRVTQTDAMSACHGFRQSIDIPAVGTHVQVTGSYVLDKEHGKWAEIHPVTYITKIP